MKWLLDRLGEHSTQVAIGAVATTIAGAAQGQFPWSSVPTVLIGAVLTSIIPATK